DPSAKTAGFSQQRLGIDRFDHYGGLETRDRLLAETPAPRRGARFQATVEIGRGAFEGQIRHDTILTPQWCRGPDQARSWSGSQRSSHWSPRCAPAFCAGDSSATKFPLKRFVAGLESAKLGVNQKCQFAWLTAVNATLQLVSKRGLACPIHHR